MSDDDVRIEIRDKGFLSQAVCNFPDQYKKLAPAWFELAERFSGIGQRIAIRAMSQGHGDGTDPRVYGTLLLIRTLQSYQAAVLLARWGLATEARMLIRSCFENAFCIASLNKDPAWLRQALIDDHKASRRAQAKFLVSDPRRLAHLDEQAKDDLVKFASTVDQVWGKVKQLAIDDIAKSTELADDYLFYRLLAADSAHPSLTSLQRHLQKVPAGWDYVMGPAPGDSVADSLIMGCHAIMSALVAFTQLVNDLEDNKELAGAVRAYTELADSSGIAVSTSPSKD